MNKQEAKMFDNLTWRKRAEAAEAREAQWKRLLIAVLNSSGARGRYNAIAYSHDVEAAEVALANASDGREREDLKPPHRVSEFGRER
jgi:hypothetical protein